MRASCPICADVFDGVRSTLACRCGHVFHEDCLLKWINQSHTCPECRKKVTVTTVTKLFFNVIPSDAPNLTYLENELDSLKASINAKDIEIAKMRNEKAEIQNYVRIAEDRADQCHVEMLKTQATITTLQLSVKSLNKLKAKISDLEKANATLHTKVQHLHNVQHVISGSQKDLDDMLQTVTEGPEALKQMATYCSLLKRELSNLSESKQQLRNEITFLRKNVTVLNVTKKQSNDEIQQLKEQVSSLEKENMKLMKRSRVEISSSTASKNNRVKLSTEFESPTPERLKKPLKSGFEGNISVTPVRDRIAIEVHTKLNVHKGSMPYERTFNLSKPAVGQSSLLKSLSNVEHKLHDNDSIMRNGYNGLGGHSNFISSSLSIRSFKPPHKRKP